jgi:hypothetical protein
VHRCGDSSKLKILPKGIADRARQWSCEAAEPHVQWTTEEEQCSKHMFAATLATDQGLDDIGGATFQRCPHPWHRNHRRRLSGAAGRTRSAFVASHFGHGGIRRRSWGRTSLIREATRSGSLCIAPLIRPTVSGERGIRRITQFAFGVQPVVNIVPILSTPVAIQVECALGDVALGQHWRDRCRGR